MNITLFAIGFALLVVGFLIGRFVRRKKKVDLSSQKASLEVASKYMRDSYKEIDKVYNFFQKLEKELKLQDSNKHL